MKPMVVVIIGPTASGKTALGVALAKHLNGEVVSADSMQIYQGMDIATAKPTAAEMDGVPHHLIGFVPPGTSFSVAQYKTLCYQTIDEIHSRGKVPILVGGTGLYIDTVLYNTTFFEEADTSCRAAITARAEREGTEALLAELAQVDPETADKLHLSDRKRIIRALEVYYTTGRTISSQRQLSRRTQAPYRFCLIGLTSGDRGYLYDRINRRVDAMAAAGLLDEARAFLSAPLQGTAKQAIGYKELQPYFDGMCDLDAALDRLKMETRRYAKRQLTWFRRNPAIHWLMIDRLSGEALLRESLSILAQEMGADEPKGDAL